ncbi:hypothetical protein EVAR_52218_1 [Eumeta japonica]|uniref:Uncharacterized protein n=1 Tax=Eumeta variegata TaxID=151549 RepID=A0A4C1Z5X9_EUMVA|nr:hypothetical protein EVAR_52218_1 [Eumeta japonica]
MGSSFTNDKYLVDYGSARLPVRCEGKGFDISSIVLVQDLCLSSGEPSERGGCRGRGGRARSRFGFASRAGRRRMERCSRLNKDGDPHRSFMTRRQRTRPPTPPPPPRPIGRLIKDENRGGLYGTIANQCTERTWCSYVVELVDSRQRPAAHVSAWRSGLGHQLTWTITSPASASTNHIADTSGASRRGRARRPRGPTQAVLSACVLPNTRAVRRASRRAPDRPAYFCDYPQFIEIPAQHHRTKADVAAF